MRPPQLLWEYLPPQRPCNIRCWAEARTPQQAQRGVVQQAVDAIRSLCLQKAESLAQLTAEGQSESSQ